MALTGGDGKGRIGVMSLQPLTLTQVIPLGVASSSLNDVALNASERLLFAAEREAGALAVIDVVSSTLVARWPVGALPNGVAVQQNIGYVANFGSNSMTIFNPVNGVISSTLSNVGAEPSLFAVETVMTKTGQEQGSCCSGGRVFLSLHGDDQVKTYAGTTAVAVRTGMADAYGLAYDPATRRLYVANRGPAHTVSVVDSLTNQIVATISTAEKEPYVVAVNPNTGHLFVVCDGQVRVYRTGDRGLLTIIAVASGYNSRSALDTVFDRVYVTDYDTGVLSVIQDGE